MRDPSPTRQGEPRRAPRPLTLLLAVAVAGSALSLSCARDSAPPEPSEQIAALDTLLVDVGGTAMERLDRGQRWRTIASLGTGLPPETFTEADLPEPDSYGAGMVKVYCDRCHWLPAPAMHSAEEWPLLIRRMQLRAATLERRMGGPLARGAVGDLLLAGMASTELEMAATEDQLDSLRAYLVRNALPTVESDELGDSPYAERYRRACATCHELPDPAAYTTAEWEEIVRRMPNNMRLMNVDPIDAEQQERILEFLRPRAGG